MHPTTKLLAAGFAVAFAGAKVSPEWKSRVGVATSVNWPVGVGGKGNEGVAGLVRQTPGAIGYVELIYALQSKIAYGAVQNAAGEFLRATPAAVTKAAEAAAARMPADFRVSITNAPGAGVYPISSFTWLLLYDNPQDKAKGKVMVEFMKWALTDGQKFATELGYFTVVLPAALPGILTGILLTLARVAEETAPLLFTAFNNRFWSSDPRHPMATLTVQIYTYAVSPYDEWHRQAWAGALVLLTLVVSFSVIARLATARLTRLRRGA